MELLGHSALVTEDGESALDLHLQEPFDVLVLDWVVPRLSGLEVVRRIRSLDGDTVIVMVTSREHGLEEAFHAGVDDFVVKPINIDALRTRVLSAERTARERRRRAEAETNIREGEARVLALIENTHDALWSVNRERELLIVNSAATQLFRLIGGSPLGPGNVIEDGLPETLTTRFADWTSRALGGDYFGVSWSWTNDTGRRFSFESSFNPIWSPSGVTGVSVFTRNVTERIEAERSLRRTQRDFREVIELAPDGIVIAREGRIVYVNAAFARLCGPAHDHSLLELVLGDDREKFSAGLKEPSSKDGSFVCRLTRGEQIVITEVLPGPEIEFEGQRGQVISFRDVTERRRFEAQLELNDRLRSLGTLAAGVAHELNNPLGYVTTNLEFIQESLPSVDPLTEPTPSQELQVHVREAIAEARDGVKRVARIVEDLSTFSRVERKRQPVDVARALEVALKMTRNVIPQGVEVIRELSPTPTVIAHEGRLIQVFVNLLTNAAQAVEAPARITTRILADGDRTIIEIEDTGPGVPEEIRQRVFDPFFTRKPIGAGTGLGLSICHGIITSLEGTIEMLNGTKGGARVRIALPQSSLPADLRDSILPKPHSGRRARVLVIDDEPLVGKALARALKQHDVTVTTSGHDALAMLRESPFDVVFCDLMMPEMSGMEIFQELERTLPEVCERVVFITGGAFTASARSFIEETDRPTLLKPFRTKDVREIVAARIS